jgi:hypothetical protein
MPQGSGGGGTEEQQGGDAGGGDEGDEESEDDENGGSGGGGEGEVEVVEGSSNDEFESVTSTPWPEGVGTGIDAENPFAAGFGARPTPHSVIDTAIATLKAMKRANAEIHRIRRKVLDIDGPGWMLFAKDTRGLGIVVYQLNSEEDMSGDIKATILVVVM